MLILRDEDEYHGETYLVPGALEEPYRLFEWEWAPARLYDLPDLRDGETEEVIPFPILPDPCFEKALRMLCPRWIGSVLEQTGNVLDRRDWIHFLSFTLQGLAL
jgi:hypothetical protein